MWAAASRRAARSIFVNVSVFPTWRGQDRPKPPTVAVRRPSSRFAKINRPTPSCHSSNVRPSRAFASSRGSRGVIRGLTGRSVPLLERRSPRRNLGKCPRHVSDGAVALDRLEAAGRRDVDSASGASLAVWAEKHSPVTFGPPPAPQRIRRCGSRRHRRFACTVVRVSRAIPLIKRVKGRLIRIIDKVAHSRCHSAARRQCKSVVNSGKMLYLSALRRKRRVDA